MPYKPTGRKPGRPKKVKTDLELRTSIPVPLNAGATFDIRWAQLTPREKQIARYEADQRGVRLDVLLEKWPIFKHKP